MGDSYISVFHILLFILLIFWEMSIFNGEFHSVNIYV